MSLTASPPVQDPAPCDVDDAVIKEAKRRARRRRWSYSGLVVALATVVAFVAWGPTPPVQSPPTAGGGGGGAGALAAGGAGQDADDPTVLRVGFVGLPPERAVPSSPATGDLVLQVMTRAKRVWVYADGRMISYQNGAAGMPEAANDAFSGFLEQHLTAEGVELLRSYLVNGMTASSPADELEAEALTLVRMGDEVVRASVRGCGWEVGCSRITEPETWLPASAWVDQQYRAYVPTEFEICYFGWETAPTDLYGPPTNPQSTPIELVRAALPPQVAALLWPVTTPAGRSAQSECAVVSTEDARAADRALRQASVQHNEAWLYMILYVFEVPPPAGRTDTTQGHIGFQPVLPHGYATCTSCG